MGGLEHAPGAWMWQLINSLPRSGRVSMFQTCKPLARQVLAHVPNLQFWVCKPKHEGHQALEAMRSFMSHLLDVNRDLEIVLQARKPYPFPTKLSHRVVKLTLSFPTDCSTLQDGIDWAALENLQELALCMGVQEHDVHRLCDALEAGHLKQVKRLLFNAHDSISSGVLTRLASVIGPQVSHLHDNHRLQANLHYFTSLQSIQTWEPVSKALREHPTVRIVPLMLAYSGVNVRHNTSQSNCKWETLVVECVAASRLLALPLAGLKEIQFHGYFPYGSSGTAESEAEHQFISQYRSKILCKPYIDKSHYYQYVNPTFYLHWFSDAELLALSTIKDPCQLHLRAHLMQHMGRHNCRASALWSALPACIHTIMVTLIGQWDCVQSAMTADEAAAKWLQLWQELPRTVTTIVIGDRSVESGFSIALLARSLPCHIRRLNVPERYAVDANFSQGIPARLSLIFYAQ